MVATKASHLSMKVALLLFTAFAAHAFAAGDESIPVAFAKERYSEMVKECPFGVSHETASPPPPPENPFANIVVRGLGSDFVVIQRHGEDQTIRLVGGQSKQGFTVKKINWSNVPGTSTVTLVSESGEEGIVGFDQNLVHATKPALPGSANSAFKGTAAAKWKTSPKAPVAGALSVPHPLTPAVQPKVQSKPSYGGQNKGMSPSTPEASRVLLRGLRGGR